MKDRIAQDMVAKFVLAGSATFTIENTKTGNRFTFRIDQPDSDAPHFVSVLTGPDNGSDFSYLGTIFELSRFVHGKKSSIGKDAPSAKAFRWLFDRIRSNTLPECVAVYHLGRCGRCGRALTVPESIQTGLGPKCRGLA